MEMITCAYRHWGNVVWLNRQQVVHIVDGQSHRVGDVRMLPYMVFKGLLWRWGSIPQQRGVRYHLQRLVCWRLQCSIGGALGWCCTATQRPKYDDILYVPTPKSNIQY